MSKKELEEIAKEKYDVNTVTGYWKYQGFLDAVKLLIK